MAADGTAFMDEIGELPLTMQSKLMRVFAGPAVPVGGTELLRIDFRLIAATKRQFA